MNEIIKIELLGIKKQILTDYQPTKVSIQAMKLLLDYSSEIPYELQSDLHSLIAMDMDEFILPQEECIEIIDRLIAWCLG
ncbi:hypothetical protein I6E61_03415 [Psychrobacter sp. NZS113]|uniref:hypothetical protein n=1 Tax=Psychrobacter sp. NZS113 TaxID=2792045 RepID=UPI0018CC92E7|nr:hypothetical protein [Psychrobacter sp. NZS113]MBH0095432.1 hypothetical protein [Psychrobacter sp. NZS113]